MSLTLIRATALSLAPSVGQFCHQVPLRPSPVSQWEEQMPIFIYRGRYSADAVKGMMTSPEDREAALAKVFEKAGGKLLAFYLTFGEDDFLTIADCPDHHAALALAIAGAAGGGISDMKTTVAVTSKEAMAAFKRAGELAKTLKPAGR
jgi:uncharacterized protein with GYD domain